MQLAIFPYSGMSQSRVCTEYLINQICISQNYKSIQEKVFFKCWFLDNLCTFCAKLNIINGSSKIRHKQYNLGNNIILT